MRLFNFLNESRSKSISQEEFISGINKHCKQALKQYNKGHIIWRNIVKGSGNDYLFIKPTGELRKSAYTSNHYTLWLNNHSSWKDYPKREIICSGGSGERAKTHYGGSSPTYVVLPFDNAKIGICPRNDIWLSFQNEYIYDLDSFNYNLTQAGISDKNWSIFMKNIKFLDKMQKEGDIEEFYFDERVGRNLTVEEFLEETLDPNKNGFKVQSIKNYNVKSNNDVEVWTDSPCYMIEQHMTSIIDKE